MYFMDYTFIIDKLSAFIHSGLRNTWVMTEDMNLYVRKSKRSYKGVIIECFDFASIEIKNPGNGIFTELLKQFELKYPHINIFVESVLTDRFSNHLKKTFIEYPLESTNFFKVKN